MTNTNSWIPCFQQVEVEVAVEAAVVELVAEATVPTASLEVEVATEVEVEAVASLVEAAVAAVSPPVGVEEEAETAIRAEAAGVATKAREGAMASLEEEAKDMEAAVAEALVISSSNFKSVNS